MAVEQQTVVNAPAEKVFMYLADITKHPEWGQPGHKLEVKKMSDGPVGQGSTFQSVGHQFGKNEDTVTITEYVPNQRIVYECDGNAGKIRHAFELAPADSGTRVTKSFDVVTAKFPFSVLAPLAKALSVPGTLRGDLSRIKANLEGS